MTRDCEGFPSPSLIRPSLHQIALNSLLSGYLSAPQRRRRFRANREKKKKRESVFYLRSDDGRTDVGVKVTEWPLVDGSLAAWNVK